MKKTKKVIIVISFAILILCCFNLKSSANYNTRAYIAGVNNEAYVAEAVNYTLQALSEMGYNTKLLIY